MQPSRASLVMTSPVLKLLNFEFGIGPPVPALGAPFFFECGHPNWSMNPSITRWKCNPS